MENLKKFNSKSYLEHLSKTVENMNEKDAYIMQRGIYLLWKNMNDYYADKYGSPKRLDDLYNYVVSTQRGYLRNIRKEEELPY